MVTIRQIITYLSFFDLLQPRAEDVVVQIILAKTDSAVDNPEEQGQLILGNIGLSKAMQEEGFEGQGASDPTTCNFDLRQEQSHQSQRSNYQDHLRFNRSQRSCTFVPGCGAINANYLRQSAPTRRYTSSSW